MQQNAAASPSGAFIAMVFPGHVFSSIRRRKTSYKHRQLAIATLEASVALMIKASLHDNITAE